MHIKVQTFSHSPVSHRVLVLVEEAICVIWIIVVNLFSSTIVVIGLISLIHGCLLSSFPYVECYFNFRIECFKLFNTIIKASSSTYTPISCKRKAKQNINFKGKKMFKSNSIKLLLILNSSSATAPKT